MSRKVRREGCQERKDIVIRFYVSANLALILFCFPLPSKIKNDRKSDKKQNSRKVRQVIPGNRKAPLFNIYIYDRIKSFHDVT